MADVTIRGAVATDLPFIYRGDLAYMREFAPDHATGWSIAIDRQLETWTQNLHRLFMIEVAGEAAGFALWTPEKEDPKAAVIVTVHVVEKFRRQGLAKRVLERTVEDARTNGYPVMTLGVDKNNPAKKLYEAMGFTFTHEDDVYLYYELRSAQ
jgi:ribosomal-protein-alanine N-acetyltransferase